VPQFADFSLTTSAIVFAAAAVAVWIAGTKLAGYAGEIATRTGIGEALVGVLLLAFVTSLPEIATSLTAATIGNAALAVNNLLGSIAMQVAVLAVADLVYSRRALTSAVPDSVVMLQGAMNVTLLSVVAVAASVGDVRMFGAGLWSWGLLGATIVCFRMLTLARTRRPWIANLSDEAKEESPGDEKRIRDRNAMLGAKTAASAAAILVAGYVVARSGENIALQTGLGSSFTGVALVAIATSLPEASTVFAAARRGLYTMAISDILGTNILNAALLFGVDLVADGEPIFDRVGSFAAIGAMLGVVVTGLFLIGLAERRDRTVLRMGYDSVAVLLVYAGGLVLLYFVRGMP